MVLTGWGAVTSINIPGSIDGILEDHIYLIRIDYDPNYMKSDFGDIRFTLEDDTLLDFHLLEKIDEDYAIFNVQIPTLPESPTITPLLIYGKNPTATTTSTKDIYLFHDFADEGVITDKWNITHSGGGVQSYDTVEGINCIKISNSGDACWITTKDFITEEPFKVEADMYLDDVIGLICYMRSAVPDEGSNYRARFDSRSYEPELIDKDGVTIGTTNDISELTLRTWYPTLLGVDQNGEHIWKINDIIGAEATDDDYTSGHLGLMSTWQGFTAFSRIRASKHTANPPIIPEVGEWNLIKEKARFRCKLKIPIMATARFRCKLWIKHESARFRSKIRIYERGIARFRCKIRTSVLNPVYIRDSARFRCSLSITPKQKARFRCKLKIKTGETRIELFARIKPRNEELNDETPTFDFIIGDQ